MKRFYLLLPALALIACARGDQSRTLIQNKGSDTLVNVAQAWAEAYKTVNPNVAVAVTGGGTGTGIAALINGTVDLASASREMSSDEIELAQKRGVEPVQHVVGYDALAVFLHYDNPLAKLSLEQLGALYGEGDGIEQWSQLGVEVAGCPSGEIVRISRQNNSGTYEYFKEAILGDEREYKLGSRDMHGSKDVVDLVAKTPCAIGYSGLAYATPEVKMPCVARDPAGVCVTPSVETAIDRSYPIARPLFLYTVGAPTGEVKAYLDWILSSAGQCLILDKGYAPVGRVDCE